MNADLLLGQAGSLHRRLVRLLLFPLLALLLLSLAVDYQLAFRPAIQAYDHALIDDLLDLSNHVKEKAGGVSVDLPPAVHEMLRSNVGDEEFFAVFAADGRLIAGDPGLLPEPGAPTEPISLTDSERQGQPIRKATYRLPGVTGTVYVVMAETTLKRRQAGSKILIGMMLPNLVLILATALLVGFGVRRGLQPLSQLGEEISRRPRHDLGPLPAITVPKEAAPLIAEITSLIDNLRVAASAHEAFLADAAHQLKTPLAGLQTQLDLLVDAPSERREQRLTHIRESMDRLNRMTHQLLALARSTPEALAASQPTALDLSSLIDECASAWFDQASERGLELHFETAEAQVRVVPWLLREALGNLFDNAVRYSGADARITLRCGVAGDGRPYFEIEDTGPGIASFDRDHVFDRFYRGRSVQSPGTGLGLAIVREVALRHGATASIHEGAEGRGTRIRLDFPAAGGLQMV